MTLTYREVTGLWSARVPDGPDSDQFPDTVLLEGHVTFEPEYRVPLVYPGEHIVVEPMHAVIHEGVLYGETVVGDDVVRGALFLPVTVDEAANQTWSWVAKFQGMRLGEYGEEVALPSVRFQVPAGDDALDLSEVIPVSQSGNTITLRGPGLSEEDAQALVDAGLDERGLLPGGSLPSVARAEVEQIVAEAVPSVAGVPIFETLAEAQAWEAANPGRVALTLEGDNPSLPIVPLAPTMDDVADTYTIPVSAGVEYLVGGTVVEAGTYSVGNVAQTITVTARATGQRPLTGETMWPLVFTLAPEWVTIAQTGFDVPDDTDVESIPLTEPAGGTLVKDGQYALAVESGRLIKRDGAGAQHTGGLTISSPANVSGIRTVRFTLEYDLTAGTSVSPGFNVRWSALFNGGPSSAVMQLQVRRAPDGTLQASGAGNRVTDVQTLVGTIPTAGTMIVTVGTAQVAVEVDGIEVVSAAIASQYTLNPEQSPRVELLATTPALDSLLIEAGT